jgi:PAS domain S-box-containing protein
VQQLLGYQPEDLIGKDPYTMFHPDDRERIRNESHKLVLEGDTTVRIVYRIRKKSGEYRWFETLTQPILDGQGHIVHLETCSRDVSERVEAENRLRESQQRYRSLVTLSPDAIIVRSGEQIVFANPAAAEMLGAAKPEDLVGRNALEMVDPAYHEMVRERIRAVDEEGRRM